MNFLRICPTILVGFAFALSTVCNAEIAIIVSKSSPLEDVNVKELRRIYLGKSGKVNGVRVTPFNHPDNSFLWDQFNRGILNKSSSQIRAHWTKLVFIGKGTPPEAVKDDEEMIVKIQADPKAIGYIDFNSVTADVKVLLTL